MYMHQHSNAIFLSVVEVTEQRWFPSSVNRSSLIFHFSTEVFCKRISVCRLSVTVASYVIRIKMALEPIVRKTATAEPIASDVFEPANQKEEKSQRENSFQCLKELKSES